MKPDFSTRTLKPGDTIGILGGGQLGRMLALAAAQMEMPQGDVRLEGIVWKRFANGPRYRKRYLFIQGGMLCYVDPKSSTGENAIVMGPITAVDITSAMTYELSFFLNERQLLVRVETQVELDAWYHMGQLVAKENFLSRTEH